MKYLLLLVCLTALGATQGYQWSAREGADFYRMYTFKNEPYDVTNAVASADTTNTQIYVNYLTPGDWHFGVAAMSTNVNHTSSDISAVQATTVLEPPTNLVPIAVQTSTVVDGPYTNKAVIFMRLNP